MAKSLMWAVNGDQSSPKPAGVSPVYIVNGDTSIPRPAGVSEVYAVNGDTSIPRPAGVSSIFIEGVEGTVPSGVSVVSIPNYSRGEPDYNPLNLPQYTIRLKFTEGITPTFAKGTAVQVSSSPNIWDLTYEDPNWNSLLRLQSKLEEVLGANTSSVTSMGSMFYNCNILTTVPLFDTRSVTDMKNMFDTCGKLTAVPLFDTSLVMNMSNMFYYCRKVESGALALYQQASSQVVPPSSHSNCFKNCGSDTETGAAELAQIPTSWGGNGA